MEDKMKEVKPKKVRAPRKKKEAAEILVSEVEKPTEYLYAIGRRKEAIAQVRLLRRGEGVITVNARPYEQYFPHQTLRETVRAPLEAIGQADKIDVAIKVQGGGLRGQAEAARLGIARALLLINPTFRISLKRLQYLKRDPRVKERKKYGLKKARRAPQWAKR